MADSTSDKQRDDNVSAGKKLDELRGLVEGIEIAMFTTRRPTGDLVSRPMATQKRDAIADFWYVTDVDAHKLDELEQDAHVNLGFYNNSSREWVSVAGTATISQDRAQIRRLYQPDWRAWFGDEGGERNGGPDDPRLALILVHAHSVMYSKNNKPKPVILFEVAKAMITGNTPDIADLRHVGEGELHAGAKAKGAGGGAKKDAGR